jgi:dynein heavy chain
MQDLEDRTLKLLRESTGNILDDEVLVSTLNNARSTSQQAREEESREG